MVPEEKKFWAEVPNYFYAIDLLGSLGKTIILSGNTIFTCIRLKYV